MERETERERESEKERKKKRERERVERDCVGEENNGQEKTARHTTELPDNRRPQNQSKIINYVSDILYFTKIVDLSVVLGSIVT